MKTKIINVGEQVRISFYGIARAMNSPEAKTCTSAKTSVRFELSK